MALTLSKYLRLRIDSNLTANAKYNLGILDGLGSTFNVDTTGVLNIRSESDILIEPNSADLDSSGVGGTVRIGSSSHQLDSIVLNAASVIIPVGLGLFDQGIAGTNYLQLKYNSTLNGSVDSSDRTLTFDLEGADREVILGGDLSLADDMDFPANAVGYLINDGAGALAWQPISTGLGDVKGYFASWLQGDGLTKTINHNLLSSKIEVSILDESGNQILVDNVQSVDPNTALLTSSETPVTSWTVVVHAK